MFFCFSVKLSLSDDFDKGMRALNYGDYKEALYYLSYYAVLGDPKAQYNLGLMYNKGLGVDVDKQEAIGWFFLSSEQGNMLAQYSLGLAYLKGNGVSKDNFKALNFFKKAAYQGHPSSQVNLGNMYFKGHGTLVDFARAHMWYNLAKEKGLEGAYQNIIIIENLMSDRTLQEAVRLYNNCQHTTLPKC